MLRDVEGLVKLVDRAELAANDWSLTPGRYVGVAPEEVDEEFDFEETLRDPWELEDLNAEAVERQRRSAELRRGMRRGGGKRGGVFGPFATRRRPLRLRACRTNRRRMALLEQAARLLYREWFVHLHFPGHEHVRVVDGVPEGWERKRLGEVAPLKYGKALKEENRIAGTVPVFGSSGIVGTHDKALVQGPGIVVGRKGNAGSVFWSATDFFPIDTVFYIDFDRASLYLYYALLHKTFVSRCGSAGLRACPSHLSCWFYLAVI